METEQKSFEGMVEVQQNTVCLAHYSKYEHKLHASFNIEYIQFSRKTFPCWLNSSTNIQSK